jgi:HK97 gp10 family phage protein
MPRVQALDVKLVDPNKIDADIRRVVVRKAANVVRKHVRAETPKRTGKLKRSISVKVWARGTQAAIFSKKPHAHLVLGGTQPHDITLRKERVLTRGELRGTRILRKRSLKIGEDFVGASVRHHGSSPNDFFTRGAENSRGDVEQAIRNAIGEAKAT